MGYPMTFKRVINRSRLSEGGYQDVPDHLKQFLPTPYEGFLSMSGARAIEVLYGIIKEQSERHNSAMSMLLGDLRRLQADTVDESAICQHIARRTGIEPDVVAAVLKEFVDW